MKHTVHLSVFVNEGKRGVIPLTELIVLGEVNSFTSLYCLSKKKSVQTVQSFTIKALIYSEFLLPDNVTGLYRKQSDRSQPIGSCTIKTCDYSLVTEPWSNLQLGYLSKDSSNVRCQYDYISDPNQVRASKI